MLSDEVERYGSQSPESLGGSACHLHVYVDDATVSAAVDAGARLLVPVADQFYGDRSGRFEDPFGHVWIIATRVEDMTPAVTAAAVSFTRRCDVSMQEVSPSQSARSSETHE